MPSEPAKAQLRALMLARRREAHATIGDSIGRQIALHFFSSPLAQLTGPVAGYLPIGEEADPMKLLDDLAARQVPLSLPVVTGRHLPLEFRCWLPGAALEAGVFGTRHPTADADGADPALLLVPLLAFDRRGGRLGYGAGYYDRTLAQLRSIRPIVAVGIAFAAQQQDRLPLEPHDQRLDWIVTEQGAWEVPV